MLLADRGKARRVLNMVALTLLIVLGYLVQGAYAGTVTTFVVPVSRDAS